MRAYDVVFHFLYIRLHFNLSPSTDCLGQSVRFDREASSPLVNSDVAVWQFDIDGTVVHSNLRLTLASVTISAHQCREAYVHLF